MLSGKRRVSTRVIQRICDRLSVRPDLRAFLLSSIVPKKNQPADSYAPVHQIAADAFAVIADWYHFAILELTFAENFDSSPRWIAKRLGISTAQVKIAVDRLKRIDLLREVDGRLRKTKNLISNGDEGFSAPALKELQRQVLEKALHAIDHVPQQEKDITSMTMAIDERKLPEAKRRLQRFRRELCAYLEAGPRSRVYHLGLQLYPVSESTILKKETK